MDVFGEGGVVREFHVSALATDYDIICHNRPDDRESEQSPMVKDLFELKIGGIKLEPNVITITCHAHLWKQIMSQVKLVIERHLDPRVHERMQRALEESKRWDAPIDTADFAMESGAVHAMGNSVFVSLGSKEVIEPETTQNEEA